MLTLMLEFMSDSLDRVLSNVRKPCFVAVPDGVEA